MGRDDRAGRGRDHLKPGESLDLPPGTNKDGLVAHLNGTSDEHGIFRSKQTGGLYVIRGTSDSMVPPSIGGGSDKLAYHNHPSGNPYISGLGKNDVGGDQPFITERNPGQRSTIIGTPDGTYRNRVPPDSELFPRTTSDGGLDYNHRVDVQPTILGGTGPPMPPRGPK